MLAITFSVSLFLLGGAAILSFFIGFMIRGGQLKKWKDKVIDLESEMLTNHADILQLQKEKALLEQSLKSLTIPVISMNSTKEEKKAGTTSEVVIRKQLLQQPSAIKKHS